MLETDVDLNLGSLWGIKVRELFLTLLVH